MIFFRLLAFAAGLAILYLTWRYTEPIVRFTGHFDWADRWLGMGTGAGTYYLIRLIGIAAAILGTTYLFRGTIF